VQKSSDPLALEQFLSAFLLLMMGILLAAVFLLLEHLYFKYIRQHLAKSDDGGTCAIFSLVSDADFNIARIPLISYAIPGTRSFLASLLMPSTDGGKYLNINDTFKERTTDDLQYFLIKTEILPNEET
jgi:hypothetical protein